MREGRLFHVGLGAELKQLREVNRMSTRSVARALGTSPAWVSRTETGERRAAVEDVHALCRVYEVNAELREQLAAKAEGDDGVTTFLGRDDAYSDEQANLTLLEEQATGITVFELALVPGLLQTAEYAHHIIGTVDRTEAEVDRRVSARLGRQVLLTRSRPPRVRFYIDEFALHRPIGGSGVMQRQLWRLVSDGQMSHVHLRVVPAGVGAYSGLDGPFTLFEFPALDPYVYLENRLGGVFVSTPEKTGGYVELCRALDELALDAAASAALITDLARRGVA
ncbi:helix-turn-helix domain-containing protein [Bounagaea algeriensis]